MEFNLTSWAGVTAGITLVISGIKTAWPAWVAGKEPKIALVLGLALGIAARVASLMTFKPGAEGYIEAILGGLAAGVAAQVSHDYLMNPLLKGKSGAEK